MTTQVSTKLASQGSFPELLRRSRFASFDPKIRQSYGAPPSHLHRGNWGLKRPIAQRKRNAFITLKNFEEHEHYIEWDNAESQVRLINKIEELNIAPKLVPNVPWYVGLGPAASSQWSKMDSEFAPGETGMPHLPKLVPSFTPQLEGLGLRGKGEYGMKPSTTTSDDGYLHPNLRAMPPKVFKRYLKKLRSLRPEFLKFLKENNVSTSFRETGIPPGNLHIRFLGQHFDKQYQDTRNEKTHVHPNQAQPIRQQPHRLGGLTYASPTFLETFLTSSVQPGIVLEDGSRINFSSTSTSKSLLVSTAGIVGRLDEKKSGVNVKPAFNAGGIAYPPEALLARQTGVNTFINVKVVDLQLERLPAAVTAFPSANSSKEVGIRMELVSHSSENDHSRTNTHPPGSMLYNAPDDSQQQKAQRLIFSRKTNNQYKNPEVNRLHELGDLANKPHEETTSSTPQILNVLNTLKSSSMEMKLGRAGLDFVGLGRGWSQPKPRWIDGQEIEGPYSDEPDDDGDTGQDSGTKNV